MKNIIFIVIGVQLSFSAFAQTGNITMPKHGKFLYDGQTLMPREVLKLMKENPDAHRSFKKALSNYDGQMAFGFVGGFLIGWPIGTAIGGGDAQMGSRGRGGALTFHSVARRFQKACATGHECLQQRPDLPEFV